jgi:hypothetical protein
MTRSCPSLAAALLALLVQVSIPSFACSPAVVSASDFVQHAPPEGVGFSGTVVSVVQGQPDKFGTPLTVTVKTKKWFLGSHHQEMRVRGFATSSTANVPCHGVFDFNPTVGAEVVVFGQLVDGVVLRRSGILEPLPPVRFSYK